MPDRTTSRQSPAGWAGAWSAGCLQARVGAGLSGPLDRHPDQVPPLHPRAVVVPHPREPKQLGQDKPGMAGALTDAAVGDDVVLPPKAQLPLVNRPQLLGRLN